MARSTNCSSVVKLLSKFGSGTVLKTAHGRPRALEFRRAQAPFSLQILTTADTETQLKHRGCASVSLWLNYPLAIARDTVFARKKREFKLSQTIDNNRRASVL